VRIVNEKNSMLLSEVDVVGVEPVTSLHSDIMEIENNGEKNW